MATKSKKTASVVPVDTSAPPSAVLEQNAMIEQMASAVDPGILAAATSALSPSARLENVGAAAQIEPKSPQTEQDPAPVETRKFKALVTVILNSKPCAGEIEIDRATYDALHPLGAIEGEWN